MCVAAAAFFFNSLVVYCCFCLLPSEADVLNMLNIPVANRIVPLPTSVNAGIQMPHIDSLFIKLEKATKRVVWTVGLRGSINKFTGMGIPSQSAAAIDEQGRTMEPGSDVFPTPGITCSWTPLGQVSSFVMGYCL